MFELQRCVLSCGAKMARRRVSNVFIEACPKAAAASSVLSSVENRLGGGSGHQGVYGTLTGSSAWTIIRQWLCPLHLRGWGGVLDLGAGLNRFLVLLCIAAWELGVVFKRAPLGIEFDDIKVDKARSLLQLAKVELVKKGILTEDQVQSILWPVIKLGDVTDDRRPFGRHSFAFSYCKGISGGAAAAVRKAHARACKTGRRVVVSLADTSKSISNALAAVPGSDWRIAQRDRVRGSGGDDCTLVTVCFRPVAEWQR